MKQFMDGVSANGNHPFTHTVGYGGRATIMAWGTWGGGTLTIEVSPDEGTTWIATTVTFNANGVSTLDLSHGEYLFRGALTGATTPSLNAVIV